MLAFWRAFFFFLFHFFLASVFDKNDFHCVLGYYSYLYAKCFAATMWQKLCQEDPLSLTTGTALRKSLLQHGGAREPASLLNGLVGEGILRYCDGGIVPDITSFCDEMKLGGGF